MMGWHDSLRNAFFSDAPWQATVGKLLSAGSPTTAVDAVAHDAAPRLRSITATAEDLVMMWKMKKRHVQDEARCGGRYRLLE